ncbi:hypothetical protein Q6272_33175, partial [Klebsiella pneumoniae]|uniref:hypothetical protein n=1 Tax=Klebsiella pneumoniae TaxID=573 RepID=UPI0027309B19
LLQRRPHQAGVGVLQDFVDLGGGGKVFQQLGQGRVALVLGELGAQLVDQQPVLVGVGRLGAGFDGLQQMGQADQGQQL